MLEKIKLMYFMADPVNNRAGVVDMVVLLQRLIERTAAFSPNSEKTNLHRFYEKHEADIGALDSVKTLGKIHTSAQHLLTQMARGLDYFGYTEAHVPLTSLSFFKKTLEELVDNFSYIGF